MLTTAGAQQKFLLTSTAANGEMSPRSTHTKQPIVACQLGAYASFLTRQYLL